jgi:uncharacterized membrane protein
VKPTTTALVVAAVLGWAALDHGFGGFLLMALFLVVALVVGRYLEGRRDLRRLRDGLTGRRSSS